MAEQKNFWSSLPGILTGIAAIITALTGLFIAINSNGPKSQPPDTKTGTNVEEVAEPNNRSKIAEGEKPIVILAKEVDNPAVMPDIKPDVVPRSVVTPVEKKPFPETGPLVDCALFPTVNSVGSLMSWSNHYHQQVVAAGNKASSAKVACNYTIDYRGMAHCKEVDNLKVRQALLETLILCREAGIEWQDIQHSTILTQE